MNDHVWHALTGLGIMVSGISFSVSWLKGYQKPVVGKPKSTRYFRSQWRKAHVTLGLKNYPSFSGSQQGGTATWNPRTQRLRRKDHRVPASLVYTAISCLKKPTANHQNPPHPTLSHSKGLQLWESFFKKVINSLDLTGTFKDKQEYLKGKGFYLKIRNPLHKYPAFQENKKITIPKC